MLSYLSMQKNCVMVIVLPTFENHDTFKKDNTIYLEAFKAADKIAEKLIIQSNPVEIATHWN